jgi:hypothetical protein
MITGKSAELQQVDVLAMRLSLVSGEEQEKKVTS